MSSLGLLLDFPAKVQQKQFWFFEFCKYFFGTVDLVVEVDAAVVETFSVVQSGGQQSLVVLLGRLLPQKTSRISSSYVYLHRDKILYISRRFTILTCLVILAPIMHRLKLP